MTTFSQITLVCPHCDIKMMGYDLMSYTVYNTTVYSDGFSTMDPFSGPDKAISICPGCNEAYWREDARMETDDMSEEDLPSAGDVYDLPFALSDTFREELILFYNNLLQKGFANTRDRKVHLRFRIWWGINDFVRDRKPLLSEMFYSRIWSSFRAFVKYRGSSRSSFKEFEPLFNENLQKLIAIFQPEMDDDQMLLAEMYRELGKIRKAKKLLLQFKGKKGRSFRKIQSAVLFRKKKVMKL